MTLEGRRESSLDEISRAREELRVAEQIVGGAPRVAATRIYYAVFHAVRGLLFQQGLEAKTHAGVEHLFRVHFVKPGKLPPSADRLFSRLQKFREEADYAEAYVADEAATRRDLAEADALVGTIETLLRG